MFYSYLLPAVFSISVNISSVVLINSKSGATHRDNVSKQRTLMLCPVLDSFQQKPFVRISHFSFEVKRSAGN